MLRVTCPICDTEVSNVFINSHLDTCLDFANQHPTKINKPDANIMVSIDDNNERPWHQTEKSSIDGVNYYETLTNHHGYKEQVFLENVKNDESASKLMNCFEIPESTNIYLNGLKTIKHEPFTQSKRNDPLYVPYYVTNFEHILNYVMNNAEENIFFNSEEKKIIETYRSLSLDAKKLFVRLFQRKISWILKSKISYEEIQNIENALRDLINCGLLMDVTQLHDLEEILLILSAADIRLLCKEMNIISGTNLTKSAGIASLINHSKRRNSPFFKSNSYCIRKKMTERSRNLLAPCFRLDPDKRKIYNRTLTLYSIFDWWRIRDNNKGSKTPQLTSILLVNQGVLVFPVYEIYRETNIFRCRDDLIAFEVASELESKMSERFEVKDYSSTLGIIQEARKLFQDNLSDCDLINHVTKLPIFLRQFLPGSILAYVLTQSVDALEKLRRHEEAIDLLQNVLLSQRIYLKRYRTFWLDRLTLDLDQHLREPKKALKILHNAFNGSEDLASHPARLLTLCQRVEKICLARKNFEDLSSDLKNHFKPHHLWLGNLKADALPTVIIQGRILPKTGANSKTMFILGQRGDGMVCGVEQFVAEHYKTHFGYLEAIHCEGSIVNTIMGLLFWDIIYEHKVPDVFRGPNQSHPLDFDTEDFFKNRRSTINTRLDEIRNEWSRQKLYSCVKSQWERNFNCVSCVAWDCVSDVDKVIDLMGCFSTNQIAALCERLIENHRETRSGVPDLTVWNGSSEKCALVEVKGPGDRLSNKQIIWINFLNCIGVNAMVCKVEVGGSRVDGVRSSVKLMLEENESKSPKSAKFETHPRKYNTDKCVVDSGDDFDI